MLAFVKEREFNLTTQRCRCIYQIYRFFLSRLLLIIPSSEHRGNNHFYTNVVCKRLPHGNSITEIFLLLPCSPPYNQQRFYLASDQFHSLSIFSSFTITFSSFTQCFLKTLAGSKSGFFSFLSFLKAFWREVPKTQLHEPFFQGLFRRRRRRAKNLTP